MTPALAARAYERVLNRADMESHAREQIPVATAIDDPMPPQTTPARPPEQEMPPAPTQAAPTVPVPVPVPAPESTPPGDRDSADEDIQHLMATPHTPPASTASVPSVPAPDPVPAPVSASAPSTGPAQPVPAEPTSVDAPTTSGPEPTQRPIDPEIAAKYPYLFGYNSDNGVPAQVGSLPWIIAQTEEKKSSQADATTVEQTLIGQIVLGTGPAAPSPAASTALELIIPEAAIPSIASDVNSADPLPSASGVPDPRATGLPDSIRDPRVIFRIGAGYPASQLIADLETIRVPPVPWVGQGAHPWDAAMARLQAAAYTPPQQLEDLKSATSDTLPCLRNEAAWYTEARQQQERQQREARRRLDEARIPWRDPGVSEHVRYLATIPVLTSPSEPVDNDPELSLGGVARQFGHMAVGIFAMTDLGAVVNNVGGWFGRHPNLPTSDDVAAGIATQVEAAKAEADKGNTAGVVNHLGMASGLLPDWRDPNSVVAFGIALGAFGGAAGRGKPGSGGVDAVGSPAVASGAGRVNRNSAGWTDHIDIYSQQTQIPSSHVGKPSAPHEGLPLIHPDAVPKTTPAFVDGIAGTRAIAEIDPWTVRFSQNKVNDAAEIIDSMRQNGWVGPPIDLVRTSDGALISVDNTRVLAAKATGTPIEAVVHAFDEPIPPTMAPRFVSKDGALPTTWGEAVQYRIGRQSAGYRNAYPNGSPFTGWSGN
ncbi:hypothetical protein IU449_24565 [Nocardia higoensis]|uniref:Uncharacterized protein n=1 Tax=Nocardia higoensis TaxID=228599 RepID=A0ABS0DGS7_9NOCA|nr:hypothetical protein [Nocardia higoensis]MBF6357683.1 hypothetical protein [Nocardia higoensis]